MRLLLIDADKKMAVVLKAMLAESYAVDLEFTGEGGEYQALIENYDLIILDLILPDIDGLELCKRLRHESIQTPVLILTHEFGLDKKIAAFDRGVDDYLTKPFSLSELRARIKALVRRQVLTANSQNLLSVADLTLDTISKAVKRADQQIELRRKEYDLLEYLLRNAGKILTRDMILDHVWDDSYDCLGNTVDVHIKYLRDSIDEQFDKKLIKTVHGLGYKIEA